MNVIPNIKTGFSACPHDCPSTCALEIELLDTHTIGRVRGARDNTYTLGVICEKVARYAERIHHPDRLLHPLKRKGQKGGGEWQRLSWEDALAETAEAFLKAERSYGPEAVWPYLEKYTDAPRELEAHLKSRTPEWAAAITGCPAQEIEAFARLIGETRRTYIRLGYGFARSRNGSVNMHAVTSIAAVTGAWQHEGGGCLHSNSGMYKWNKTLIEGLEMKDSSVRTIDQCRIGPALLGDPQDLAGGPPVTAMLVQNTNPASVAPAQTKVKQGLMRDDLFLCVQEQFMTETAKLADIVLPATMFLEHDDIYQGGGHQHIMWGGKLIEPPGECRSNHQVICDLARLVGAEHRGFSMSVRDIVDETLRVSKRPGLASLDEHHWIDVQQPFDDAHFLNGFAHPDGKYRFKPDWKSVRLKPGIGPFGPVDDLPEFPE